MSDDGDGGGAGSPHLTAACDAAAFSAAMRERRRALGLTQKEVALVAGLGRVAVLRLENEPDRCQLQTALAAAKALGLRVELRLGAAPRLDAAVSGYGTLPHETAPDPDGDGDDRG